MKKQKSRGLLFPLKEEDKINDLNYIPLNEHPNPSFKRNDYLILHGFYDFKITNDKCDVSSFSEKILVPYSPESPLSHVSKLVEIDDFLIYQKNFKIDTKYLNNYRIILHVLGIDQTSDIYVNNNFVSHTESGYLSYEFDVTNLINNEEFNLRIIAQDKTETSFYSRGKQKLSRGGIFYTSTSGIYRPIYLEFVPLTNYITNFNIDYDIDKKELYVLVSTSTRGNVNISFNEYSFNIKANELVSIKFNEMELWDVDNPKLYEIKIKYFNDEVHSYIGFRKIELVNVNNKKRLYLNHHEIIIKGVLDQGYYYLGNLTPRDYLDYYKDIQNIKDLGFNAIRKHIKYENDLFYHYCDKLGVLVIQDAVNGGEDYSFLKVSYPAFLPYKINQGNSDYKKFKRTSLEGRNLFVKELVQEIKILKNHPSIIIYTLFNEGWGQFDTIKITSLVKKLDNTRLIDATSGWYDNSCSDFYSKHIYFTKVKNYKVEGRAYFLSECGGLSFYDKNHFFGKKKFGYKMFSSEEKLTLAYKKLFYKEIIPTLKEDNIGFIFTQISDVEDEVNGLFTFDRKVLKIDKETIIKINDEINKIIN